jgi:hypothetical protein
MKKEFVDVDLDVDFMTRTRTRFSPFLEADAD